MGSTASNPFVVRSPTSRSATLSCTGPTPKSTSGNSKRFTRKPSTETTPPPKKKNEARPKQREQNRKINRPLTPNKNHGAVRVLCACPSIVRSKRYVFSGSFVASEVKRGK